MQFMRHGYTIHHRALGLYPSRNVFNKIFQVDVSMSVQHMSSKGKAKATNPDSDFQKLASVSPDPCAGRLTSVEDPTCRNRTVSRVRDRGMSMFS